MKSVKGCVNTECVAQQKRTVYKANDEFCTKCGSRLQYVCAYCHKQLPDGSKRFCDRCQADKKDRSKKRRMLLSAAVATAAAAVATTAAPVVDFAKKIIKK